MSTGARCNAENIDSDSSSSATEEEQPLHEQQRQQQHDVQQPAATVVLRADRVEIDGLDVHFRRGARRGEIGDRTLPIGWFSLTVTKSGDDLPLTVFEKYRTLLLSHFEAGAASLERGGRLNQLHIQSFALLHAPDGQTGITRLNRLIRNVLSIDTRGYKLSTKRFGQGQAAAGMAE